jgi:hypothetical protein
VNIREQLLQEHSRKQALKISAYIAENKVRFNELMKLFFSSESRVVQRAAMVLYYCYESNPGLIVPHLKKIILNLKNPLPDAVKRNSLRMLQFIQIPKPLSGTVADVCFSLLNSSKEPVAVKVFSMTILLHIVKQHPGLGSELKETIEAQLPYASSGFLSRGKKVLAALKKL